MGYQKETDSLILQYQIKYSGNQSLANPHYVFVIPNGVASLVIEAYYIDNNRSVQKVNIKNGKIKVDAGNFKSGQIIDVFVKLNMSKLPQPGKYKFLAQEVAGVESKTVVAKSKATTILSRTIQSYYK